MRKYKKLDFGDSLPFVVLTDSRGKALAHANGFKGADFWNKAIEDAKKSSTAAAKKWRARREVGHKPAPKSAAQRKCMPVHRL